MNTIGFIFLGSLITIIVFSIFKFMLFVFSCTKHCREKLHCNECEVAFLSGHEIYFEYCPYCGRKLTYYYEDERYNKGDL